MRNHAQLNFKFLVEIGGMYVGGFSEVSGIGSELAIDEYAEGGLNDYKHKFPGRKKTSNLVLKRGITISSFLWDWYSDTKIGNVELLNGTISVQNRMGIPIAFYSFFDAYPVKWQGPDLNSNQAAVAIESIELAHNGFTGLLGRIGNAMKK